MRYPTWLRMKVMTVAWRVPWMEPIVIRRDCIVLRTSVTCRLSTSAGSNGITLTGCQAIQQF